VLTANHVVKKVGYGVYEIITHDGQKYQMENKAQIVGKLDLALVRFTSSQNYPLAKIADSRTVKEGARVYYAGFPATDPRNYRFMPADITGRRQDKEGYELSYSGPALDGMSGGPVLNEEGFVIAIHGQAETRTIRVEGVPTTTIVGVLGIPTEKFPNLISPSPTDVTFQKLEALLKAEKWRDADLETWDLMLKLTKREQEGWLRVEDAKNFPKQELQKMDQLWVEYSNGKFGFSVQKQIWLELGGKLDGESDWDTYQKFGDRVGWKRNGEWILYSEYTFSTNSAKAHLPSRRGGLRKESVEVVRRGGSGFYSFLFSRL
jgi:hypothetical protein